MVRLYASFGARVYGGTGDWQAIPAALADAGPSASGR